MNRDPPASVARDPAGGAGPGLVLAGQHALRDRREHDLAEALLLAQRQHLGLDDPPEHAVLRLVGDDPVEAHLPGDPQRGRDLLGPPLRDAHVQHLALADQVVEGAQGLLQRRLVVVAVGLVQVDVVGPQPAQRAVRGLHDVLAGQAPVVRARGRPASRALVKISSDSRRTPCRARPSTSSARVPA